MKSILGPLRLVQSWLGRAEEALGMALVAALAIVVNLQIFSRYLFHAPFIWPEEVARLCLVWMGFIGAAALTRRGADIAVDTFVLMLPERGRRYAGMARDAVMIVVFVFVAIQGFALARAVQNMPLIATGWPTAMLAWPVIVGAGLTAFHCLVRLLAAAIEGEAPPAEIKVLT
jgi:TRAP-type C4-dicarboxylate transport system permease small subunit